MTYSRWREAAGADGAPSSRWWHLLALGLTVMAVAGLDAVGAFRTADNAFVAARMEAAQVPASGDVVLVAIDHPSLVALGSWPWSREVYAELVRRLLAAGATEIFLDLDFSSPSTPEADAALALAFAEAGGSIVLPAFRQAPAFDGVQQGGSQPLPEFRENAWIAAVNVNADVDGVVRRYPYGTRIDGEEIDSAASILSGVFGPADSEFLIDFAIDPDTVPKVSVIDVLEGRETIDFTGRSVVIGARALEIRQSIAVPVHSLLSGPLVQILATETLAQDRVPRIVNRYLAMGIVGAIAASLSMLWRGRLAQALLALAGVAAAIELLAFWLQTRHALIVQTPELLALLVAAMVVVAGRELDIRRWLLQAARLERGNSERVLERVIADSSDAVLVVDEALGIVRLSRSAGELFELPEGSGRGAGLDTVVPAAMTAAVREAMAAIDAPGGAPVKREAALVRRDGSIRQIEYVVTPSRLRRLDDGQEADGGVIACLTVRDVTADREQRVRIDRLARFDTLTGALNRSEFIARLGERIRPTAHGCALIVFNLHRLQTVNATLGRETGDALLVALVERVNGLEVGLSPVARLGGDRFAMYALSAVTPAEADRLANRVVRMLAAPFRLNGQAVRIGMRVGLALGTEGDDAELLLGKAELALDEARVRDGPGLRTFDEAGFARQARARQIERAHWNTLNEEQLFLAYQPQVRLSDGALIGAEALVRWRHPTMGTIAPSEFIEIAEGSGFIEHLGRWVLETACLDAAEWPEDISVSVNVSPAQFHRSDLVADVERALAVTGLPARRLCLEITESLFFDGTGGFSSTFAGLRGLGVALALDDFGAGYSSFGHLARLPVDKLKVDQMFVQGLETDSFNEAVIRSVVSLCREVGLTVVCEGVETQRQEDALRRLGCEEAQGYFYGRPEPKEAFAERLRVRRVRQAG